MAFGSAVFAAGPYNCVFGGVSIGLMRGDAQSPVVEIMRHTQLITDTHLYARTPIGAVGQGGEAFASFTLMEAITGALAVLWPYSVIGKNPTIGVDDYTTLATTFVLTAAAGTLASGNPASISAAKAVLAEDFPMRYVYGPILRELPIRLRLFPNDSSNQLFWTTA